MTTTPSADEMPDFENASCKGHPTNWWYPSFPMNKQQHVETKIAKKICRDCRIKDACLTYSLKWEPIGIWGGVSEKERNEQRIMQNIVNMRPISQVRRQIKKKKELSI